VKTPLPKVIVSCAVLLAVTSAFAQSWTQTSAKVNNYWGCAASSADGNIILAGVTRTLVAVPDPPMLISTNSGVNWATNYPYYFYSICSSADATKLAGITRTFGVLTSTNSGSNWMTNNLPQAFWNSIASSADGSKLVVAGNTGVGIYTSHDSGNTWKTSNVPDVAWMAVASSADGSRLVALGQNYISTSTNSGNTWTSTNFPDYLYWDSVAASADGSKLVASVGYGRELNYPGPIYTSSDSGNTWKSNNAPILWWTSVASSADGCKLVAVAYNGNIYTSTDSGDNWTSNSVTSEPWTGVASSADGGKLVAVAYNGGVWTKQTTQPPKMNITSSNSDRTLSWIIPSTNFVLQQNPDLTTSDWTTLTNTPTLNLSNLNDEIILSASNTSSFFRLMAQ
jgi:hypothetical protein